MKIKIGQDDGTRVDRDLRRVEFARDVIGDRVELFVDANGGYEAKQAVRLARQLEEYDVRWFEEPVSSDDLTGLRTVRKAIPLDVAAGEYGYDLPYFQAMCAARAVDVLQVDVSRCAGITEWMRAAAVAAAHGLEVSGHCAQSLHAHPACAVPNLRHLEYFHDHARLDRLLFDGVLEPDRGMLRPGVALRRRTRPEAHGRPAVYAMTGRARREPRTGQGRTKMSANGCTRTGRVRGHHRRHSGVGRATAVAFAERGGGRRAARPRGQMGWRRRAKDVEARGGDAARRSPTDVVVGRRGRKRRAEQAEAPSFGPIDVWVNDAMTSVFSPVPGDGGRRVPARHRGDLPRGRARHDGGAGRRMVPRDRGMIVQVGSALAFRSIPLQSA